MSVPDWVPDSVFYQIFPDRFENGDRDNDPANLQPWGSKPTLYGFQGGDLKGIIQRFDYLIELGINALYLNPIFLSTSNHRYNTTDYFKIDPGLGSMKVFKQFLDLAHRNAIRVILDGVFNHCGRGFFAFQDLLENEKHSAYKDWFYVNKFPLEAYGSGKAENYAAWWDVKSLPKFNIHNPEVRAYLLEAAQFWIEQGVDGWRLDVPNEIDDDSFWPEFREVVKAVNPEAYLVGEIWEADPHWVGETTFDGLINYPFRQCAMDFLAGQNKTPTEFASELEGLFNLYPQENSLAHLLPLGSHDTRRVKSVMAGNGARIRLLTLLQFFFPGVPLIFYGDEIGLEGGKDPDCRKAFLWDKNNWDHEQQKFIRKAIDLRKKHPQLRRGNFSRIFEDDRRGVAVFMRSFTSHQALLALNISPQRVDLLIDDARIDHHHDYIDALSGDSAKRQEGNLELRVPSMSAVILVSKPTNE